MPCGSSSLDSDYNLTSGPAEDRNDLEDKYNSQYGFNCDEIVAVKPKRVVASTSDFQ